MLKPIRVFLFKNHLRTGFSLIVQASKDIVTPFESETIDSWAHCSDSLSAFRVSIYREIIYIFVNSKDKRLNVEDKTQNNAFVVD